MNNYTLSDTDVKQLIGQAEVDKTLLRKINTAQAQEIEALKKENAILREALGQEGIKAADEEAVSS